MRVTTNYEFPLQWDQYESDRDLLTEALKRIDAAIKTAEGGVSSTIIYDGVHASLDETVSDALDRVIDWTDTFQIAMVATAGADVGEPLWAYSVTQPFTLPADLPGSEANALAIVPLDMVIRIEKNGVAIGTLTYEDGSPSYDFIADVSFAAGDVLVFVAESTVTFRSISATLVATRI